MFLPVLWAGPACAYVIEGRWSRTATNSSTGTRGTPITLTWSLAPDGTQIPANSSGTVPSNLLSFLDGTLGIGPGGSDLSERPWFSIFDQSFARLGELSGVSYIYEPNDDGRSFNNSTFPPGNSAQGALGVRGDVRIGGKSFGDGSNTLAANFFPDYGEMMINTDKGNSFNNGTNNYRFFRNVVMHEAMHGLGVSHVESSNASFLLEPTLSTSFDGPQLDDLLALQRNYGDVYEKNGGNDTFGKATPLGMLSPAQSIAIGTLGDSTTIGATQVDFLSIDDATDTDFFSFSVDGRLDVDLGLTPRGTSYLVGPEGGTQSTFDALKLSNLSLALYDTNGTSLLDIADDNPAGGGEEISRRLLPGTYFARVKGAENDIQLYGLNLIGLVPPPANLLWVGNLSSDWDVELTANFSDSSGSVTFYELDNVTFDDTSSVKTVNLPSDVSASDIHVNTADRYVFSGAGGILAGSLTVEGPGSVELANSGNSYSGPTQITSGTLVITGDANAMVSPIVVAAGATLVMDAADAAMMASAFTVHAGGTLQIGTLTSDANVFPDAPSSIMLAGMIRLLNEETLRSVSGSGQILVEHDVAYLSSNDNFDGKVVVMTGAQLRVLDGAGLGSAVDGTVVEGGGSLVVDTSSPLADPLSLAGDGLSSGAVQIAAGQSASLTGHVTLADTSVTIGVAENASATFSNMVDGEPNNTRLTVDVGPGGTIAFQQALNLADGGITKRGPGSGLVAGTLNYVGATVVEQGVLRLSGSGTLAGDFQLAQDTSIELAGSHQFGASAHLGGDGRIVGDLVMPGMIAPGISVGTLAFAGDLTLVDTSLLEIELGGTAPGIDFDALSIDGVANLDGILDVSFLDDFMPTFEDSFELLCAEGGIFGQFEHLSLPALESELIWNVVYGNFAVLLKVVNASIVDVPGDFNDDGSVDAADYVAWRKTYGTQAGYDAWRANFGTSLGVGNGAAIRSAEPLSAAVPEPATLALLILAAASLPLRRRRITVRLPRTRGTRQRVRPSQKSTVLRNLLKESRGKLVCQLGA